MERRYDCFIIGTGVVGATLAPLLRKEGWSVGICDERPFGGTCALRGCHPKKILNGAAEVIERSRRMAGRGIAGEPRLDWQALNAFKRSLIDPVPERTEKDLREQGIDCYHGRARFTGTHALRVGEEEIAFAHAVIATGARPRTLKFPGAELLTTSDELFDLESPPPRIAFVGGGYVSFEFAHLFARAGAMVRILHRTAQPLARFDPQLVGMLLDASREAGIAVDVESPVTAVERRGEEFAIRIGDEGERWVEADLVVHGAGRVPNLDGLDLAAANVGHEDGRILVNDFLQSMSNLDIFVAGDANHRGVPLTPFAGKEAEAVVENMVRGNTVRPRHDGIPSILFAEPKLASCGLTEERAKEQGVACDVHFADTSEWGTTKRLGPGRSAYKVLVERGSGRIRGAHLLGHNVDETINLFALAMQLGLPAEKLKEITWAFPSVTHNVQYMVG